MHSVRLDKRAIIPKSSALGMPNHPPELRRSLLRMSAPAVFAGNSDSGSFQYFINSPGANTPLPGRFFQVSVTCHASGK